MQCDDLNIDWESPSDFLVSYLKTRLGNAWFNSEKKKSDNEKHEVIKWYCAGRSDIAENIPLRWHQPNGQALALLHLAYDLFVLDNSGKLSERFINRIKDVSNFNGARYEAFVFATLIRAGLDLKFEDEVSGKNGRVFECKAEHVDSGEYVFIEAKTRNVRGVLGSKQGKKSKIKIYNKLKDTVEKSPKGPYIIFVDLNFPELKPVQDGKKIEKLRVEYGKLFENHPDLLPNLIVFTNIPFHYGRINFSPNETSFGFVINKAPRFNLKDDTIVNSIIKSIKKYSFLPSEFSS